jgi:hypothetical protein
LAEDAFRDRHKYKQNWSSTGFACVAKNANTCGRIYKSNVDACDCASDAEHNKQKQHSRACLPEQLRSREHDQESDGRVF